MAHDSGLTPAPMGGDAQGIIEAVRAGEERADDRFDRLYDAKCRQASKRHWTPIATVRCALDLLQLGPDHVLLDVGSGAGKFCLAASLMSPARFVGVERRPELVRAGERARRCLGADRVHFFCADALELDWSPYDAIYLFNPFEEHLMEPELRIDNSVPFSGADYAAAVGATRKRLKTLKVGARVVVNYGFGDVMPPGFQRMACAAEVQSELEAWSKLPSD
ncbi:MAG TPA: methyltransferase domain-containing protein [Myxococcaceae bacterium]|nr:methyltransferase domain-containing protein [Myxococcaceae bacterium]